MKVIKRSLSPLLFLSFGLAAAFASSALGDDAENISSRLSSATRSAANETFRLQYRFQPGETLRWKVVHLATTETTIQGNTQTSQSRSTSTKVWKVTEVTPEGNFTFVHMVSDADMWKKVSGRPEERYNSKSDETPPIDYEQAAQTIGKPLASFTVDPSGAVLKRKDLHAHAKMAHGQVMLPLPEGQVKPGHTWYAPDEVVVRLPDRRLEKIKTRQRYVLEEVESGVATISIATQVLTPVNDPKVRSQLLQQITEGEAKFDITSGRLLSKRLEWDETVIGFNGPESILKFLARGTEQLLTDETAVRVVPDDEETLVAPLRTAAQPAITKSAPTGTAPTETTPIRRRDGDPIYRR
ncbi:MAG: hypothetical protein RIC55_13785 [Pirellulaceae bacterium]